MSNISAVQNGSVYDVFSAIDRGNFTLDIEEAVREVVNSTCETGKKGSVTITLSFDPDNSTDALRVVGDIKKKLPAKPKKASMFFVTPEGNLVRNDPRQPSFNLPYKD